MSKQSQSPTPAVYRRRRLLAVVILVMVVALVVAIIGAVTGTSGGKSDGKNSASASASVKPYASASASLVPSASPSASASVPASSAAAIAQQCTSQMVSVSPATTKSVYGKDEDPVLLMKIKNVGKAACVMNLALSDLHFVVVDKDKVVWRMEDCLVGGSKQTLALQPGTSQTASYTWRKITSADGHCSTDQDKLFKGPADLGLSVSVLGISSLKVAQFKLAE